MTEVHRIRGVAGGGKSTQMLGDPDEGIKGLTRELADREGYDATDFRWVSFSSSHQSELQEKVRKAVKPLLVEMDDEEVQEWGVNRHVSTLHSLCLQLSPHVAADDIICPSYPSSHEVYETFWEPRGVPFNPSSKNPLRIVYRDEDADTSRAEKLVTLDQLLTLCGDRYDGGGLSLSVRAVQDLPVEIADLHPTRIVDLIEDWREWKDEHGIYEHHDYILEIANSSRTPDCNVLMIDEMQDYAPIEYAVIKEWIESGDLDHVVLAGDEFQSIYGFKKSSPYHFVNRDVDEEEVMRESYRCPAEVCRLARDVLPESNITSATDRTGKVIDASVPTSAELADLVRRLRSEHGEALVLTRTNRQSGYVSRALQREGVPFCRIEDKEIEDDEERRPWRDDLIDIASALRSAKHRTGRVSASVAETLFQHTQNPDERKKMAETGFENIEMQGEGGGAVDIWSAFPDAKNVSDILRRISLSEIEQDMIEGVIESRISIEPERVAVGTIHAAKGREAPATAVLDAYPEKLAERYRTDSEFRDEERRLAYVAVTRASETLAIVRDFTDSPSFQPISPNRINSYSLQKGVIHDD